MARKKVQAIEESQFFGDPVEIEAREDGLTSATTVAEIGAASAPGTMLMSPASLESIVPMSHVSNDPRTIDPNILPSHQQPNRMASFKHPDGFKGTMFYDRFTLRVKRWNTYSGKPLKLPPAFAKLPQPEVATCTAPGMNNRGCDSWTGCPFASHGPFRIIMRHKDYDEVVHANHCYNYWVGFDQEGKPVSQIHLQMDGWVVDTRKRTIPYVTTRVEPRKGHEGGYQRIRYAGEYEVLGLGPMYHNTPPAVVKPERRLGEVSIHESLSKWAEPSEEEVAQSGAGNTQSRERTPAQGRPEDRPPFGKRADGVARDHRGEGHGKRRGRPKGRVQRRISGPSPTSVESKADQWRGDALRADGKKGRGRGKRGGEVQAEGVRETGP